VSDEEVTDVDLVLGERKFLHELSNKLIIIQGMSSTVLKRLKAGDSVGQKELDKIEKVLKAGEAMVELLQNRRSVLQQMSVDKEENS